MSSCFLEWHPEMSSWSSSTFPGARPITSPGYPYPYPPPLPVPLACPAVSYVCVLFICFFSTTELPFSTTFDCQTPIHSLKPISNITSLVTFSQPPPPQDIVALSSGYWHFVCLLALFMLQAKHVASFILIIFMFLSWRCGNFKD